MRGVVPVLLVISMQMLPGVAYALSMAFVNPGKTNEPFWILAVDGMQQAASSLNVELEIITTERDYLAQVHLVESLAQRPVELRPDYLIIAAEKSTVVGQLKAAKRADIPVLLAFNAATGNAHEELGYPRQRFPNWLGSVAPMAEEGGYIAAKTLITHAIEQLPEGTPLGMIALAADRSTHTSLQRNQGLFQALEEFPQVQLHQQVHADWSYDKALEQTTHMLRRYPDAQLIWSANDLQAFGAIRAIREAGRVPGKDVFVSAINATTEGLEALLGGELSALAGGHHMAGAWAVVLLHDYHHGVDFIGADGNAELEYSMFSLLDKRLASRLLDKRKRQHSTDFCPYSRVCNPVLTKYDFSYASWLDSE